MPDVIMTPFYALCLHDAYRKLFTEHRWFVCKMSHVCEISVVQKVSQILMHNSLALLHWFTSCGRFLMYGIKVTVTIEEFTSCV